MAQPNPWVQATQLVATNWGAVATAVIPHTIFQRLGNKIYEHRMRDCPQSGSLCWSCAGTWHIAVATWQLGLGLWLLYFVFCIYFESHACAQRLSSLLISCELAIFPSHKNTMRPILMLNVFNQHFDYALFILMGSYVLPHQMRHINQSESERESGERDWGSDIYVVWKINPLSV